MKVIEKNVITGKVTERDYTKKELDNITIMEIESSNQNKIRDKEIEIETKREAAIEEILLSGTTIKAREYQQLKRK